MSPSIFTDNRIIPDERTLAAALGSKSGLWKDLRQALDAEFEGLVPEWKHYGAKSGWIMKLFWKKRNLFFLTPEEGRFRIAFVFGDKAVEAILAGQWPPAVIEELRQAKKYAEGRGLRIEVATPQDAALVVKLARVKAAN
jgi:hypothetical protein